jgi:hypothetical protein
MNRLTVRMLAYPRGFEPTAWKRYTMRSMTIGCFSVSAAAILGVAGLVIWMFVDLPMLDASLSHPTIVQLDSTFNLCVSVSNSHNTVVTLHSIDIEDSFLEGFQVVSITPEDTDTMHLLGMRNWDFGIRIDPGQSLDICFELKAVQEGHFSGDVEVRNPHHDDVTLVADIVVRKYVGENGEYGRR